MKDKSPQAARLIHSFAVCNGSIAFALANTIVGDTVLVSGLMIYMVNRLASLYGIKDFNINQLVSQCFSYYAGAYAAEKLLFWVPGLGNWVNATTTVLITETVGWASVAVFRTGKRPEDLTRRQWQAILRTAKAKARTYQRQVQALLKKMTPAEKRSFKDLNKKLSSKRLSERQKAGSLKSLQKLYADIEGR